MIRIRGLSHRIGGATVLSPLDLTLPAGRVTALIGPNGAGKSTLLSLIGRLLPLQSGQVSVDGLDVSATPGRALAQQLAILSQSNHPASRLRVEELVAFGRWPHHQGRPGPQDGASVQRALAALDLQPLARRFLDELSGGQRQRAFLAMTLAQETPWLLLDEPLAALDMAHARAVMALLADLRAGGRSIVIVVHDINHATAWADHVVALKDGQLFADGPPAEVCTAERLGALFGMQLRVARIGGRPVVLHHLPPEAANGGGTASIDIVE